MTVSRDEIVGWVERGRMRPEALEAALRAAEILPARAAWRQFFERLTLWLGVLLCAAAVIFFLAYNWAAMGRFAKFALVQSLLAVCLAGAWRFGARGAAGKAALLGAALMVGALLALVGQTYQTGADTFELFGMWALAIFAWVALAESAALWLLWVALLNLAVALYFSARGGLWGVLFSAQSCLMLLTGLDALALACWEAAAGARIAWMPGGRWPQRVLAVAAAGAASVVAVWGVFDGRQQAMGVMTFALWLGATIWFYRLRRFDLFMLALAVLSAIAVSTVHLADILMRGDRGAWTWLVIGLIVIGMSAAGSQWLKSVAREVRP